MYRLLIGSLLALVLFPAASVQAAEAGQWLVRAGASNIVPKDDNGKLTGVSPTATVDVDDAWGFTFNVSYFLTENWAVELLAAAPYNHNFDVKTTGISGKTDHLPPTLSVQYHYPLNDRFTPYVGLGVNWTIFYNEDLNVPANLDLDDSVGPAVDLGLDIDWTDNWFFNVDVRWIDIESDAKVNGTKVGKVKIDPWVFGLNIGYRL